MPVDDAYTVALLHMDGADASTTFTDESGKVWTAQGNAQIDDAQFKFGQSGFFDGTGDYLSSPDSADWQLDGGSNSNAWTVDFWVRFNGDPGTSGRGFVNQNVNTSDHWEILLYQNNLEFQLNVGGTAVVLVSNAWNPADATWYHVAVVKDGTNGYMMFINGSQIGTTQTDTDPIPDFAGEARIGYARRAGADRYHNGWLDEVRISKGVARWTTNFTPPTEPYGPPAAGGGYRKVLPSRRAPHMTPFAGWKRVRGIHRPPNYGKLAGAQI